MPAHPPILRCLHRGARRWPNPISSSTTGACSPSIRLRPEAEAFAVRDGRIEAVGASAGILRGRGRETRIVDAGGRTVTPGIYDAHPHMDREGLKARGGIPIDGLASVAEIVEVVREAASRTPAGEWIVLMPMELAPEHGMPRYVSEPDQLAEGRFPPTGATSTPPRPIIRS